METKKHPLYSPTLGQVVRHEDIYNGNEKFTVVGIRVDQVELEGDYSGGTHNVVQKSWLPLKGAYVLKTVCDQLVDGNCPHHNIHCASPNCEKEI